MESETQTHIDTCSHETQTVCTHPPIGYKSIGMFGDSHMKTCYRFLLHTLDGSECTKDAIVNRHPKEIVLCDKMFGHYREYHSIYICHTRRLFIEYVFIRCVFDSYLESKMLEHVTSNQPSIYDAVFINSVVWDIKSRADIPEYMRRLHEFCVAIKHIEAVKSGPIRVVGFVFNMINVDAIPITSPFHECKWLVLKALGSFNNAFEHCFLNEGFKTFCLEKCALVSLASDGIHYQRYFYQSLVNIIKIEALI